MLQRGQFAGIGAQVAAHARGCLDAQRLLAVLRQPDAPDDAMHASLRELLQCAEPGRLAGWARVIQKALQEAQR